MVCAPTAAAKDSMHIARAQPVGAGSSHTALQALEFLDELTIPVIARTVDAYRGCCSSAAKSDVPSRVFPGSQRVALLDTLRVEEPAH